MELSPFKTDILGWSVAQLVECARGYGFSSLAPHRVWYCGTHIYFQHLGSGGMRIRLEVILSYLESWRLLSQNKQKTNILSKAFLHPHHEWEIAKILVFESSAAIWDGVGFSCMDHAVISAHNKYIFFKTLA